MTRPKLPSAKDTGGGDPAATERSFVVQLAADCDPATPDWHGRVQHLATCDGGNFASVADLMAIMRRVLERSPDKKGAW